MNCDSRFFLLRLGRITQEIYDKKLKEYKGKQQDLLSQMKEHSNADENFYITAVTLLDLSSRALEIFKSSEVNEKRVLLKLLLQNCVLNGRKLLFELKTPFDVIAQHSKTQDWLRGQDDVRTFSKIREKNQRFQSTLFRCYTANDAQIWALVNLVFREDLLGDWSYDGQEDKQFSNNKMDQSLNGE